MVNVKQCQSDLPWNRSSPVTFMPYRYIYGENISQVSTKTMVTMTKVELKELRQLLKEFCAKVESGGCAFQRFSSPVWRYFVVI
jgi:hypothetical protein